MPGTAARTLACAAELLARFLKLRYEGIAIASRIPRMMMTTRSSIRVKPLSSFARRFRRVLIIAWLLLPDGKAMAPGVSAAHRSPLDPERVKDEGRGLPRPSKQRLEARRASRRPSRSL